MINNKVIYRIWAPEKAKWVDWVRPVPFININDSIISNEYESFDIPNVIYVEDGKKDIAIIVDLPSTKSITEGIALAKKGYRPIPVYNGTESQKGAMGVVYNNSIEIGLIKGAEILKDMSFDEDASPVFLMDSNRTNRKKLGPEVFDNSWDIYAQDLPTHEYFKKNGINKIIIRSDIIRKDLNKILYKFQKNGMEIYFTEGYDEPKLVKLKNIHYKN